MNWTRVSRLRPAWRLLRGKRELVLLGGVGDGDETRVETDEARVHERPSAPPATARPMKVPVLLRTWELDCCLPDLAVGEEWSAPLVALQLTIAPVTSTTKTLKPLDDGRVEFRGVGERHADPDRVVDVGGSVIDVGMLRFYSQVGVVGWVYGTTSLYHDTHGGVDVDDDLVSVRGHVDSLSQGGRQLESTATRADGVIVVTLVLQQDAEVSLPPP